MACSYEQTSKRHVLQGGWNYVLEIDTALGSIADTIQKVYVIT